MWSQSVATTTGAQRELQLWMVRGSLEYYKQTIPANEVVTLKVKHMSSRSNE